MQGKKLNVDWSAVQRLWCLGDYTAEQIAEIFGINANAIRKRASEDGWGNLRKKISQKIMNADGSLTPRGEAVVESVIKVGGKNTFRPRVAVQSERLLSALEEGEVPADLKDKETFAEVLTKVEKVGSRAHGLDEGESKDKFLVDLTVLREKPLVKAD
jgi:hypothetical protein